MDICIDLQPSNTETVIVSLQSLERIDSLKLEVWHSVHIGSKEDKI